MMTTTRIRIRAAVFAALAMLCGTLVQADSHAAAKPAADAPTVLITGANRGLGLEFARQYAADGWNVIGTARKPANADELHALPVEVVQLDVVDQGSIDTLAKSLAGREIDLLINNAGIFPRASRIEEVDVDAYSQTIAVNTLGPLLVTRALLPQLRRGEKKTIVNITSRLGSIALNDYAAFYGYRESKAALNMFTKTLALELAPEGFTCLTIHPGWVQTDMGGDNATLTPEESISGMRAVIQQLGPADTGTYWSYSGEAVPW